jgi:hypothetical protein
VNDTGDPLAPARAALEGTHESAHLALAEPYLTAAFHDATYIPQAHHRLMSREIQAWAQQRSGRLMVTLPPQVGKSLTSVVWTAFWLLARNPAERIIIASCTQDLADFHGEGIRDRIKEYGPAHNLHLKHGSNRVSHFTTEQGGYVRCVGVGGMVTGFPASKFLMDDLFRDWIEAASPTIRNKRWMWAASAARTRLQPGGCILHVGTRWSEDDVAGRFMSQQPGRWRVLRLPALATEPDDPLGRPVGAPLPRPGYDEHDTEALNEEWAQHQAEQPVLIWEAMYQGDPHPPGGALIDADELQGLEHLEPEAQPVTRAVSVDPSVGDASAAAGAPARQNTFGVVAGWVGNDDRLYITHDATRIMTPEEGCKAAMALAASTGAGVVLVEKNQGGEAWRPLLVAAWERLVAEGKAAGHMPRLELHTAKGEKGTRAQIVAGMMRDDRVRFAAKLPALWKEWTAWRPGDDSPGRIDASGHLALLLLPDTPRNHMAAAMPATSPLVQNRQGGDFPWR